MRFNGYEIAPHVDLRCAGLRGSNLRCADLSGTDLSRANLSDANLSGAYLSDADVVSRLIGRATRSDGYEFCLWKLQDGTERVVAGCQYLTLAEYRDHAQSYPSYSKRKQTEAILTYFETLWPLA